MEHLQVNINVSEHTYLRDPSLSELGRKIVTGSIDTINDLGFEAFTFSKLGKKIGSPEKSIYRYFISKHMLLVYLNYWYWCWIEYKLVFAVANIDSSKERLEKAIKILTEPPIKDNSPSYINEIHLDKIVINEGVKTYHIKEVDEENKKGFFEVYKRVVQRVGDLVLEINPKFKFPHMLISTVIEGAHQQRYFAEHLPLLTDVNQGLESISIFYKNLVFRVIEE